MELSSRKCKYTAPHTGTTKFPQITAEWHNAKETVAKITNNTYFPTRTTIAGMGIQTYHQILPGLILTNQKTTPALRATGLSPHPFLAPGTPKKLVVLPYHQANTNSSPNCRSCNAYDINIDAHLPVPIAPCNEYRCIYLLHHPKSNGRKHVFLASTLTPNTGTTGQTRQETTIAKHLSMGEIRWQILTLIPGTYSPPYRTTNPKITEWRRKITKQVEDVIIHEEPWSRSFYNELDVEFRQNNQVT